MAGLTREPRPRDFDGRIAQLVEQLTLNQRVVGSSPTAPTIEIKDLAETDRSVILFLFSFRYPLRACQKATLGLSMFVETM